MSYLSNYKSVMEFIESSAKYTSSSFDPFKDISTTEYELNDFVFIHNENDCQIFVSLRNSTEPFYMLKGSNEDENLVEACKAKGENIDTLIIQLEELISLYFLNKKLNELPNKAKSPIKKI